MSLTLDGAAQARLTAGVRGAAWLIELDFTSDTLRYTTWPTDITSTDGLVYTGTSGHASVSDVSESEDAAATKITLGFTIVNTAMIALALGDVAGYRNRPARLYLQLIDNTFQPVGAKVHRWTGRMDKVQITRKPAVPEGGGSTGRIEMQCTRGGMARARNADGLRLNDAQQRERFAGDRGFEYIEGLINQPTPWLTRAFQSL